MSVRASRIGTVMSSACLHVAEAEKSGGDSWCKVGEIHVIVGWQIGKVTRMCDRTGAAYSA